MFNRIPKYTNGKLDILKHINDGQQCSVFTALARAASRAAESNETVLTQTHVPFPGKRCISLPSVRRNGSY